MSSPLISESRVLSNVVKIDPNANGTTYYGEAASGSSTASAVWQISAKVTTGVVVTFLNADGDTAFDNIWDNRLSLSYS